MKPVTMWAVHVQCFLFAQGVNEMLIHLISLPNYYQFYSIINQGECANVNL